MIVGVAAVPFTTWKHLPGVLAQGVSLEVPEPNRWIWSLVWSICVPLLLSFRVSFAIATGSPHPKPHVQERRWKYFPHCFFAMFTSGMTVWGLTYLLPKALGMPVEFYHIEFVPMTLNFTVCVVGAARFMKYFLKRDQICEGAVKHDIPVRSASRQDHDSKVDGCMQEIATQLNTMLISCIICGCEFCSAFLCSPRS